MKQEPISRSDIETEIAAYIEDILTKGQPVETAWIVHSLVQAHTDVHGTDAEWYILCSYGHLRTLTRSVLRRYNLRPERTDAQGVLPGYEHLQRAYLVAQKTESRLVPIECMTEEELLQKAAEYRAMGQGCFEHARELDRYRVNRAAAA